MSGEGRGKETASISLAFLCVEKCIKNRGQRERGTETETPAANCSNYMNNRQDCSISSCSFAPAIWHKFCNLYGSNDRSVLGALMIYMSLPIGGGGLIIFALSAQFVAFLRRLART